MLFSYIIWLIICWSLAGTVLLVNPRSEINRWLAAMAFFPGCGALGNFVYANMADCLTSNSPLLDAIPWIGGFLLSLSHFFAPYAFLMFCICYCGVFTSKLQVWKKRLKYLMLIPIAVLYIFFPVNTSLNPEFPSLKLARVITFWIFIYAIPSIFLLIYSYLKEKNLKMRRERFRVAVMIVPSSIVLLFTSYILIDPNVRDLWKYNGFIALYYFILFIAFSIKNGFFGFRIRFERCRPDLASRSVCSGTSILNHAIKNEAAKISMCTDSIANSRIIIGSEAYDKYLSENVSIITNSSKHMMKIAMRIQECLQDFILKESRNSVKDILEDAVRNIEPYLRNKIRLKWQFHQGIEINCDSIHIREVLHNILKNAVEAPRCSEITIWTELNKKGFFIVVGDNGTGISKEAFPHIFEPFFTTKSHKLNFGLGLSYCYNIMRKHGGDLEILAKENHGTSVYMRFSPKNVKKLLCSMPDEEVIYA